MQETNHNSNIFSGLLRFAVRNDEQKNIQQGQIFIKISSQPKVTCGAAAVFQAICGNPHLMHKEMSFLPIFYL
jgi:hypothetical protein